MKDEFIQYIHDPEIFAVHRLPAHSDHAWIDHLATESSRLPLDGEWQFQYYPSPEALDDAAFTVEAFPHTIKVPGHMQLQGYGAPQYTNVAYPWDGHAACTPPEIPDKNPVGVYSRIFTIPDTALHRRVVLTFDGVEPCCFVLLNGAFVGYAEDSFTPSEFDVSDNLRPGENRLTVLVPRYATASWLEDQDFWRFSGIFRSVYLTLLPNTHIHDLSLVAEPARDFATGVLSALVTIDAATTMGQVTVTLHCAGQTATESLALTPGKQTIALSVTLEQPLLWSAESPNLYDAAIAITDANGQMLTSASEAVGFRRFELQNGIMTLNGERIVFQGVNRHEWSALHGRAIAYDDIEADIAMCKRNNINAIRTSHYPNQTAFYRLCDRYGLYVIDETNLETHGTWMLKSLGLRNGVVLPDDRPEWRNAVLDRGQSLLERDKNHACVLFWSCGNESYGGKTLYELSEFFRARDPRRLVHYEGIFHDRRFPNTSDVESRMYAKPKEILRYLKSKPQKPFLLCEYAHAMGNSFGNVDEYIRLADEYPQYQGGFIWDFIDQGLDPRAAQNAAYAKDAFLVGGDCLDRPNDGYFCGDGLVFPDRTPSPKLAETKFLYAPVRIHCAADAITVENRRHFTDTSDLLFDWVLTEDGVPFTRGSFTLDIPAGHAAAFALPSELDDHARQGEILCTCTARLRLSAPYAPAGHEVAFGQTILRAAQTQRDCAAPARLVRGIANTGAIMAHSRAIVDRKTGLLTSLFCGAECLLAPATPDFWRAPTDNDIGNHSPHRWAKWKIASLYRLCSTTFVNERLGRIRAWFYSAGVFYQVTYRFYENDTLTMTLRVLPTPGNAPRAGFALTLPPAFSRLLWYGNSAAESAVDRRNGRKIALCEGDVKTQLIPYLHPQECANKTDVRTFSISDGEGHTVTFSGDSPFEISALPWTSHELENAHNRDALPPITKTVVCAADKKCGVGGDDSWGAPVHRQYWVNTGKGRAYTLHIQLSEK